MKRSCFFKLTAAMILLFSCAFTQSCVYPVKISPACQKTISACLEKCPAGDTRSAEMNDSRGTTDQRVLTDYRSVCEKNCQSSCR